MNSKVPLAHLQLPPSKLSNLQVLHQRRASQNLTHAFTEREYLSSGRFPASGTGRWFKHESALLFRLRRQAGLKPNIQLHFLFMMTLGFC
jgi:hypothetical protein